MYKCKVCGEEFDVIGKLGAHMGHKHPKNKEQVCKVCGAVFTNGGLRGHMNAHRTEKRSPTKPQTCEICGKTFTNGGLSGHMSVSHPKNGVPHPGAVKLTKVWEGLSEEDHLARARMLRDSRFKDLDDIQLTKTQEQMILGSLLGDMAIWRQHKGVTGTSNPELRISHSTKQRDYVMWKYDILKNIARREPYEELVIAHADLKQKRSRV
jgi:DNA-directed RNA polymerase subunit RPC12/RpoP